MKTIAACATALFCLCPIALKAEPIEIRSQNFIFVGDVNEKDARRLVTDLEIFRGTVLALLGIEGSNEKIPVRIYGVRRQSLMKDMTGRKNIAGVYTIGNDGPVFVMDTGSGVEDHGFSRHIALHEYAHHIIGSYTTEYFPIWYNEGFAEYISAFIVDDDIVSVGLPTSRFGELLKQQRWIDVEEVLSSVTSYPDYGDNAVTSYKTAMFYGISWIAVHYIQNTPELNKGFPDYIRLINQGIDPKEAFKQGFGITVDEFEDQLRSYWRADRFPSIQFQYSDDIITAKMDVSPLDKKEYDLSMALGRRHFYHWSDDFQSHRRGERKTLEKLEAEYGPDPRIKAAFISLEMAEGQFDAAVAHGEEAVAANPESPVALLAAGDAYYHRYLSIEDGQSADSIQKMRDYFARHLALDPTNPTANSHYVSSLTFDQTAPAELGLQAADFTADYYRSPIYNTYHLQLAEVFYLADDMGRACHQLEMVEQWVRNEAAKKEEEGAEEQEKPDFVEIEQETDIDRLDRLTREFTGRCPQ